MARGAGLGYAGFLLDEDAGDVVVQVLESADLPDHWDRLDAFEGPGYWRVAVAVAVATAAGDVPASIYVLRDDE